MSDDTTTLIFVAGAWHTQFHVQPLLPWMEKLGQRIVPLILKVNGITEPRATFQDSVDIILDAMKAEIRAGRDVVLLGHSAGGLVITAAANEFLTSATVTEEKSKLVKIIFLASFLNVPRALTHSAWWQDIDKENGLLRPLHSAEVFYNDMSVEDSKPFVDALVPVVLHERPNEFATTWHQVSGKTFIVCTKDNASPPDNQRIEAEENGMEIVEFDGDHCPFISKPEEFARVLVDIVRSPPRGDQSKA